MRAFSLVTKESYSVECGRCHEVLKTDRAEVEAGRYKCPVCNQVNPIPDDVQGEYAVHRARETMKSEKRERRSLEKRRRREQRATRRVLKEKERQEQVAAEQRVTAEFREAGKQERDRATRGARTHGPVAPGDKKKRRPWRKISLAGGVGLLALVAFVRCFLGVFVIQPIGALPRGATIVYWRHGLGLPFVASADGLLDESGAGVSLLGRGIILGKLAEPVTEREVLRLPYSRTLYLWSTGGKEYDR